MLKSYPRPSPEENIPMNRENHAHPRAPYEIEERAAIYEFEAGMSRAEAERKAGLTEGAEREPDAAWPASGHARTEGAPGSSRGSSG